jgi:hypothetical protein
MINIFGFLGLTGFPFFLVAILFILILIFEIAMIISAVINKNITDTTKILWVIGMLLIHPFVAIVYYFTDYKKTK